MNKHTLKIMEFFQPLVHLLGNGVEKLAIPIEKCLLLKERFYVVIFTQGSNDPSVVSEVLDVKVFYLETHTCYL